jgi:hypothetical protein
MGGRLGQNGFGVSQSRSLLYLNLLSYSHCAMHLRTVDTLHGFLYILSEKSRMNLEVARLFTPYLD